MRERKAEVGNWHQSWLSTMDAPREWVRMPQNQKSESELRKKGQVRLGRTISTAQTVTGGMPYRRLAQLVAREWPASFRDDHESRSRHVPTHRPDHVLCKHISKSNKSTHCARRLRTTGQGRGWTCTSAYIPFLGEVRAIEACQVAKAMHIS